jgi:AraC-like DNA-binding protein
LLTDVIDAVNDPRRVDSRRLRREHQEIVEATCAALNRSFWRSDSLSEIADWVGVSVFHLCRVFRHVTGGTIHQHREQLRLRTALQAVTESHEDLLSIAVRLGYSGHSHFTGAFHRWFGVTPSMVRRLHSITPVPAAPGTVENRT